ncbi:MAG: hypothetical protein J3K34DRAFT_382804 [Monoraphidium minutum]|nr:MAG: hypothetical protein J3K34DRAFT_382804 [Monoraphidium minutum]
MIQDIRRLIELAWARLAAMLQAAPPGSLQLSGVLGLAALLAGYYHLRGGAPPPRPPRGGAGGTSSSSAAAAGGGRGGGGGPGDDARGAQQQHASASASAVAAHHASQPQQQRTAAAAPPPAPKRPSGRAAAAAGGAPPSPLATAVRGQLAGMRRVTLSAPGVLLEQWDAPELSDSASARPCAAWVLREIARVADVFIIAHVPDDLGAATVAGALEAAGVVGPAPGQVPPQRLLLCGTADGKVSLVRQLEPDLHIDASPRTVGDLSRFVPQLLLITRGGPGGPPAAAAAGNVEAAASLAAFFNPAGTAAS